MRKTVNPLTVRTKVKGKKSCPIANFQPVKSLGRTLKIRLLFGRKGNNLDNLSEMLIFFISTISVLAEVVGLNDLAFIVTLSMSFLYPIWFQKAIKTVPYRYQILCVSRFLDG